MHCDTQHLQVEDGRHYTHRHVLEPAHFTPPALTLPTRRLTNSSHRSLYTHTTTPRRESLCLTIQSYLKCTCWHTLVLNHVAQEENHHTRINLEENRETLATYSTAYFIHSNAGVYRHLCIPLYNNEVVLKWHSHLPFILSVKKILHTDFQRQVLQLFWNHPAHSSDSKKQSRTSFLPPSTDLCTSQQPVCRSTWLRWHL